MPRDDRPVEGQAQARAKERAGEKAAPRKADAAVRQAEGTVVAESRRPEAAAKAAQPRSVTGARQAQEAGRGKGRRAEAEAAPQVLPPPRLLKRYRDEIVPAMMKEFGYTVPLRVPRLEKVVLNVGLGEALTNPNAVEAATQSLSAISGQHPVVTKARKSIANYKLRAGMSIGTMVTLRSRRMYDFLDRLANAVLPRIRDFRGVSMQGFDGRGNYSLGIREHVIFPEIDFGKVDRIRGLQATFVTSARSDQEAFRLLQLFGMPFARNGDRG